MGDTMREAWLPEPFFPTSKTGGAYSVEQMRAAHEAGRQQGMEQARLEPLSGETEEQRIEVCNAWNDLPSALRAHPGLKRLYQALRGIPNNVRLSILPTTPAGDSDTQS